MQYIFCCELFNVRFSSHIWGQPFGWKIAAKMVCEPSGQCSTSAVMGRCPEVWKILCYELAVLVISCVRQWGKQFSRWGLRDTLEKILFWRWNAHLLMESFRHTALVCKSIFSNSIISVAFCPEVQLLRISTVSLFLFFLQWFFISKFLVSSLTVHMAQFC